MLKRREFLTAASLTALTACKSTPRLSIGSKDTIENRLVSEIACQLLERKLNARLERNFAITGSSVNYQSLQSGNLDVYPEYTRIAFKVLLKAQEQADTDLMLETMQQGFKSNAQAGCLPFLGFDNSHVAVVLADNPNFIVMKALSEISKTEKGWRLGCTSDYAQSPEGYNELKLHYKIEESSTTRLEPINQLYFGLREKRVDIVMTGSTDPRLKDPKYKVLEDDLHVLGPNRCSLVYRTEAARKYPSILPVLQSLSGKLDSMTMQNLNGEIELNKRGFAEVAEEWLKKQGLV